MAFSYIGDQYKWQTGMKDELKQLEKALPKIQAVVDAAEHGHITRNLETWMWQLKDAADEADDVLDEFEYWYLEKEVKAGKNKVRDAASRLEKIMKRAVKKDPTLKSLKKAVKKLDAAAADVGVFLSLIDHSAAKSQQQQRQSEIKCNRQTSSVLRNDVFGRNKERDEIVKQLLITNPNPVSTTSKTNVPVILISGMGGVGKTTVAQYVFHDERVQNHFDLRIWICVADVFDVTMLTRKILEAVTGEKPRVTSFEMLQKNLMEALSMPMPTPDAEANAHIDAYADADVHAHAHANATGAQANTNATQERRLKRFLLVLDDVWNNKDRARWENLLAPLKYGGKGSKIVVTTRVAGVAKVINGATHTFALKGLADDDCWLLLREHAFGDEEDPDDYPELQLIGHQIAKKLKGLPLAVKTLGGLLRSNLDDGHWRRILKSDILDLQQGEGDIMPVLRLSYEHLPAQLKSCFAYCSIFPQGHWFEKDDLVRMWIAAGLIEYAPIVNVTPEDIGAKYFEDLCNRSFFELQNQGDFEFYVMHDHLHDLTRLVSAGECLRLPFAAASKDIPHSVRHLSVAINCNDPGVLDKVCKATNLRTLRVSLIGDGTKIGPALRKLLITLKSVRVLELHSENKIEFPYTIGDLIHLRYFKVREAASILLPKSLDKLYHLQFIILPKEAGLLLPPEGSSNLINLRRVVARPVAASAIGCIGKLTRLQQLEFAVRSEKGYKIGELKELKELRELRIQNVENVRSYEEACEAKMKEKECLNTLQLEWKQPDGVNARTARSEGQMNEKVLDGLQPHSNLKQLTIFKYRGSRSPCWMKANILSNLKHLYLRSCDGWKHLPPLGQLPFLKALHFIEMRAIKRIGPDLYGDGVGVVFPLLEEIVFEEMSQRIEWSIGVEGRLCFPRLRRLRVVCCSKLIVCPALPPSLRELEIVEADFMILPECRLVFDEAEMLESRSRKRKRPSSLSSSSSSSAPPSSSSSLSLLPSSSSLSSSSSSSSSNAFLPVRDYTNLEGNCLLLPLLQTLRLVHCDELEKSLPALLQGATSLRNLYLESCMHITSIPLGGLGKLQQLDIRNCKELTSLGGFQSLVSLENFHISGCPNLFVDPPPATTHTVQGFAPPLYRLTIDYSSLQLMLPVLIGVASLTSVAIYECSEVASFPAEVECWLLQNCDSLQELILYHTNPQLSLPADIQRLTSYRRYPGTILEF